jgi:hypothetical protein
MGDAVINSFEGAFASILLPKRYHTRTYLVPGLCQSSDVARISIALTFHQHKGARALVQHVRHFTMHLESPFGTYRGQ